MDRALVWTGPKKTTTPTTTSLNKTMAVQVRFNSWYISLPSSAKRQRELTKILRCLEDANFLNLYSEFNAAFHNQFRDSFDTP